MKKIFLITMLIFIIFPSSLLAAGRVSLGFLYNSSDSLELVERTNGGINEVAPTYFTIDSKGNLIISHLDEEFIQNVKQDGVTVTPFLSNNWSRSKGRAALKNKENLTNQIVEAIEKYNLDGVNIDIENLTSSDRDEFSAFIRLLKEKLSPDSKLTVSVAANPYALETGWQGSYDYMALGEVADYLFVMAYDEHSYGGGAGAVASANFVEQSIQYALQQVDKSKIVIGIPLYGRFWRDGSDVGGDAIVIGDVPRIVSKLNAEVSYLEEEQTAYATFSVPEGYKIKVNGVELAAGNYKMWYENEESIKYKLHLVNQYNLGGAGVWALGQESVSVWEYYEPALNEAFVEEEIINTHENYSSMQAVVLMWKIKLDIDKPNELIAKNDITQIKRKEMIRELPAKRADVIFLYEEYEPIIENKEVKKVSVEMKRKKVEWYNVKKITA